MQKLCSGLLLILFILFPTEIKEGVKSGLDNSFLVLVPSLFPYMVISQCFIETGGAGYIARLIYKPVRFLTGLTETGVSIYILSLFCGYPTGARLSSLAFNDNKIDKRETIKLFSIANIPGFGFCAAFLGASIFNNINTGIKLYFSFVVASFILGILLKGIWKGYDIPSKKKQDLPFHNAIVKSVLDSSISIISVIAFVCFFSCIIQIFSVFTANNSLLSVFACFTEITMGISLLAKHINANEMLICFFTAFSGLSIIFQSMSFQKGNINIFVFIFFRLIYAFISTGVFYILLL